MVVGRSGWVVGGRCKWCGGGDGWVWLCGSESKQFQCVWHADFAVVLNVALCVCLFCVQQVNLAGEAATISPGLVNDPSSSSSSTATAAAAAGNSSSSNSSSSAPAAAGSGADAAPAAAAASKPKKVVADSGEWSEEQELALVQALKQFGKELPDRWERISAVVPGKSKAACFKRFKELKEVFKAKKAG